MTLDAYINMKDAEENWQQDWGGIVVRTYLNELTPAALTTFCRSIAAVFVALKVNRTSGSTDFLHFPIRFASSALFSFKSSVKDGGDDSSFSVFFVSLSRLLAVLRFRFPIVCACNIFPKHMENCKCARLIG